MSDQYSFICGFANRRTAVRSRRTYHAGQPSRIEANLTRRGTTAERQGLGGYPLELIIEGRQAATGRTGEDGRAYLAYTPRTRGNHDITVRLLPDFGVVASDAQATVGAWERRRPILLVELTSVVRQEDASAVLDSADELTRLARFFYNVIYVSWSPDDRSLPGSVEGNPRAWLEKNNFPRGLVVSLPMGAQSLKAKIEQLRAAGWINIKAGIGRTKGFADVLVEHRIEVVLVPKPAKGELPKKVKTVKEWKDVRRQL